ncbi:MAG: hypothetical protein FNNCIFGK_01951 [Bacteroidia bacterium]|nr:hypothetical protein [Bacteroidia bacterium]
MEKAAYNHCFNFNGAVIYFHVTIFYSTYV